MSGLGTVEISVEEISGATKLKRTEMSDKEIRRLEAGVLQHIQTHSSLGIQAPSAFKKLCVSTTKPDAASHE